MAQRYVVEERTDCLLAVEALESALCGLKEDVARAARRCQEVRSAYARLSDAAAADDRLPRPQPSSALYPLTPRERLVAALAADGRSNAEIAAELHVSLQTVKSQMRSVLRKLQIESRWQIEPGRTYQRPR